MGEEVSPRIPTQGAAVDAIVDKLAELEARKATGKLLIDVWQGVVKSGQFQEYERIDLTPTAECASK